MIKIVYVPTGNVFTLPDGDALELSRKEPFNYKILDAGLQKEETKVISEEEVKDLVLQAEKKAEEIEKEDEEEVQEGYKTELNFDKFTKADLVGALRRVGVQCNEHHFKKDQLIEMANKAGIKP